MLGVPAAHRLNQQFTEMSIVSVQLLDVVGKRRNLTRLVGLEGDQLIAGERSLALACQHVPVCARHDLAELVAVMVNVEDLERSTPVRADPPIRQEDRRPATFPVLAVPEHVHADAVLVPRGGVLRLRHTFPEEGQHQDAGGPEHAVQLEQPRGPVIREMGEHRDRVHEVEVIARQRQRRRRG